MTLWWRMPYEATPLPFKPNALDGFSERPLVSHYENSRAKRVNGDWVCSTVIEERRLTTACTSGRAHRERSGMIADMIRGAGAPLQQMTGRAAGGLLSFGRMMAKRVLRAHLRRVALRELEALDDRMLKDIGLSRGSIPYEMERVCTEAVVRR